MKPGILYPDEIAKIYASNSVAFFNEKVLPQEIACDADVFLSTDPWTKSCNPY
jgi:hypothetical protein